MTMIRTTGSILSLESRGVSNQETQVWQMLQNVLTRVVRILKERHSWQI